jgi:hypothetical protein
LGLFRVPNDGIISADSLGSDMLARNHPRHGNAGCVAGVARKKLAWALIFIGVFGLAAQGCYSQKSGAGPCIEFTHIPQMTQDGRERVDAISGRVRNARPKQQIVIIPIKADSTWSTETHLGFEYAALLAEPDYHPLPTTDVAPTKAAPLS